MTPSYSCTVCAVRTVVGLDGVRNTGPWKDMMRRGGVCRQGVNCDEDQVVDTDLKEMLRLSHVKWCGWECVVEQARCVVGVLSDHVNLNGVVVFPVGSAPKTARLRCDRRYPDLSRQGCIDAGCGAKAPCKGLALHHKHQLYGPIFGHR